MITKKTYIILGLITCLILAHFPFTSNAQSPIEETNVPFKKTGQIKTKTTHEITSSSWSLGGETMDRDYTVYKHWSPYLEELGIKKIRLQGGWAKCEKIKGVYSWEWLDEIIYDLKKKEIKPWICLCYGNPLYGMGETKLGSKIDTDEATKAAWLRWVEAMVRRYGDLVNEWEIWNEPNGHNPAEVYADLLIETSEAIKELQAGSVIIGFSLAGIDIRFAEEVLKILKDQGKEKLVNYLSYHPYNFNPDASYSEVEKLLAVVKRYAPEMKLMQGENGAPSEFRKTKALNNYEWTELTQAKWVLRRMLGDHGRDIPSSVFSIMDLKYPDEMNRKGLLYSDDNQTVRHKKQSYYAVQNVASVFDNEIGRKKDFKYNISISHKNSVFVFFDKNSGGNMVAIWLHTNRPVDYNSTMPCRIELSGVNFKKPVWVDLRTGYIYKIPRKSFIRSGNQFIIKDLPVYDSPVLIAEKETIILK